MTNEQLRMQMLSGIITEGEYKAKLEEASATTKFLRKLGWAGEDLTPKELAAKIKKLSDDTLIAWSKDKNGIPNTPLAFQQKLVKIEMDKRGLKESLNESMIGGIVGIGSINQIPATPKTDYELAYEHFLGERYEVKPNRERDDINEEDTVEDMEERTEEELSEDEKPGTAKERSSLAKKARAGKDIGEKGKNFEKIAKSAAKKYGSEEAGKKVAGAVMYGKLKESDSESVTLSFTPEPFTVTFDAADFDDEEEFQEFKNELMSDENFAYDSFFDNFEGQDFQDQLEYQNQDNWKLDII